MAKVRVVVSHNNENITNDISNVINDLEYAEVIGIANNGKETYNKIIDLKPDVVFSQYYIDGMNGIEIVKLTKERLKDKIPEFNMIIDSNITDNEVDEMYKIIGNKLTSLVTEPVLEDVANIMKGYES